MARVFPELTSSTPRDQSRHQYRRRRQELPYLWDFLLAVLLRCWNFRPGVHGTDVLRRGSEPRKRCNEDGRSWHMDGDSFQLSFLLQHVFNPAFEKDFASATPWFFAPRYRLSQALQLSLLPIPASSLHGPRHSGTTGEVRYHPASQNLISEGTAPS